MKRLMISAMLIFGLSLVFFLPVQARADNWKVLCKHATGEIRLSKAHPAHLTEFIIMKEHFRTYRDAKAWVNANCPRWRCTRRGACARGPAYGGKWKVLCSWDTKKIVVTKAHTAHYPRYTVLRDRLLSMDDAKLWVRQNYPNWRCDRRGGQGSGGRNGRSRQECEKIHCPECSGAIDLLGQSASRACMDCRSRKRTLIENCMRGSGGSSQGPGSRPPKDPPGFFSTGKNMVRSPNFSNFGRRGGSWGTGQYARNGIWWNSGRANTSAKTIHLKSNDSLYRKYGIRTALYINNRSSRGPHVYGTTSQRVRVRPGRTYQISIWGAAKNARSGSAVNIAVDRAWRVRPIRLKAGSYGWNRFSGRFKGARSGYNDIQIICEDRGQFWLTGLTIR